MPLLNRREMLGRTGTGFGSLGLASLFAQTGELAAADTALPPGPLSPKVPHFAPRAKHVIHLFMNGGPSQVDTFDPKPALAKYNGQKPPTGVLATERKTGALMMSPFAFRKCGQSGIEISDIFPEIQKVADELCVVRSMHTNIPNHEPSLLMMTCGETQPTRPSMGSWLLYGLGAINQNLPGFVVMCPGKPVVGPALWSNSFLPGIFQGSHINNANMNPKSVIPNLSNSGMTLAAQREQLDLLKKLNEIHLAKRGADNALEARIQSMEMAFRMQTEAQDVFDLTRETQKTRDAYGRGEFANACLAASRMVQKGVRMVQIYSGGGQPWDSHDNIAEHEKLARGVDKPIAALIQDLKQRDLLKDTLILWGGEFGRTPSSEGAKGRDHNNHGFSVFMAGGGIRGGMTWGSTDEFGFAATEGRMHVHDLHATILHQMGLDHEKLTYRYSGRDFRLTDVEGVVNRKLLA